jgi:hypothetical protein
MKDNSNKTVVTSKGIGFTGALTIAFIVLKLCKVIDWSWVWVLSPLWISAALGVFFLILAVIIYKFTD